MIKTDDNEGSCFDSYLHINPYINAGYLKHTLRTNDRSIDIFIRVVNNLLLLFVSYTLTIITNLKTFN